MNSSALRVGRPVITTADSFGNAPHPAKMHPTLTPGCIRIKIRVQSQNSTLILIESGYCYFYQKHQYFWAFSRFKADLGSSRDRPFLRLWGFQPLAARLGFVGLFPEFVDFMG